MVYDAIAQLLPLEGRDFKVEMQIDAQVGVRLTGITALGEVFAEHCSKNMQTVLSKLLDEQGAKDGRVSNIEKMVDALKNGRVNAHIGTTKSSRAAVSTAVRPAGDGDGDAANSDPPKCSE